MGESSDTPLKLQFDRRVRLDFRGATITSDAGLLACRELDAALGLTETANDYIHESRTGRNVQHPLLPQIPHLKNRKTSLECAMRRAKMVVEQTKPSPTRCTCTLGGTVKAPSTLGIMKQGVMPFQYEEEKSSPPAPETC